MSALRSDMGYRLHTAALWRTWGIDDACLALLHRDSSLDGSLISFLFVEHVTILFLAWVCTDKVR